MFHIYGPHGPTLLSNGRKLPQASLETPLTYLATTVEVQGRWIVDCIDKMNKNNIKYINPENKAADEWKQHILDLNNLSLFPTTRST